MKFTKPYSAGVAEAGAAGVGVARIAGTRRARTPPPLTLALSELCAPPSAAYLPLSLPPHAACVGLVLIPHSPAVAPALAPDAGLPRPRSTVGGQDLSLADVRPRQSWPSVGLSLLHKTQRPEDGRTYLEPRCFPAASLISFSRSLEESSTAILSQLASRAASRPQAIL